MTIAIDTIPTLMESLLKDKEDLLALKAFRSSGIRSSGADARGQTRCACRASNRVKSESSLVLSRIP